MLGSCQSHWGYFARVLRVYSVIVGSIVLWTYRSFHIDLGRFHIVCEWLDKLILLPIDRIFLLENGVQIVKPFLWQTSLFLHINWIDQHFGIVHAAPTDHAAVISKRRKLMLLYILIDCLFDVEVFAHLLCLGKLCFYLCLQIEYQ